MSSYSYVEQPRDYIIVSYQLQWTGTEVTLCMESEWIIFVSKALDFVIRLALHIRWWSSKNRCPFWSCWDTRWTALLIIFLTLLSRFQTCLVPKWSGFSTQSLNRFKCFCSLLLMDSLFTKIAVFLMPGACEIGQGELKHSDFFLIDSVMRCIAKWKTVVDLWTFCLKGESWYLYKNRLRNSESYVCVHGRKCPILCELPSQASYPSRFILYWLVSLPTRYHVILTVSCWSWQLKSWDYTFQIQSSGLRIFRINPHKSCRSHPTIIVITYPSVLFQGFFWDIFLTTQNRSIPWINRITADHMLGPGIRLTKIVAKFCWLHWSLLIGGRQAWALPNFPEANDSHFQLTAKASWLFTMLSMLQHILVAQTNPFEQKIKKFYYPYDCMQVLMIA